MEEKNNSYVQLALDLHQVSRQISHYLEAIWVADGYKEIKMGHLQALLQLKRGNYTNNELAKFSDITKQSMSRIVKDLVEVGYIQFQDHPTDARAQSLSLSKKGWSFAHYLDTLSLRENIDFEGLRLNLSRFKEDLEKAR